MFHKVRDGDAGVLGRFLDNFFHDLVAAPDGLADVAAAQVFQIVAEHFGEQTFFAAFNRRLDDAKDRGPAAENFEATLVAATALRAIHVDDQCGRLRRRCGWNRRRVRR